MKLFSTVIAILIITGGCLGPGWGGSGIPPEVEGPARVSIDMGNGTFLIWLTDTWGFMVYEESGKHLSLDRFELGNERNNYYFLVPLKGDMNLPFAIELQVGGTLRAWTHDGHTDVEVPGEWEALSEERLQEDYDRYMDFNLVEYGNL